jgi:LmbE family N-acetylglucosaminyl deacetylase
VFVYVQDRFTRPNPIRLDVAVSIDDVIDVKVAGVDAHVSQMYEWTPFQEGRLDQVPKDPESRRAWLKKGQFFPPVSADQRQALTRWYGEQAASIRYAEGFEICELGRQPSDTELRRLFPFFPAGK